MIKIKNLFLFPLLFISGVWIIIAANNFIKVWYNWDANVVTGGPSNDNFVLDWRIDLEDSTTTEYELWHRWKITWLIESDLFGTFDIQTSWFQLDFRTEEVSSYYCWTGTESPLEIYDISWNIDSDYWWNLAIDVTNSYFCWNQYVYINLISDSLWQKEIWWTWSIQNNLFDAFEKQQIYISGIAKIKWDEEWILSRKDDPIYNIYVDDNKKIITNTLINQNLSTIIWLYSTEETINPILSNFDSIDEKNILYYNFMWDTDIVAFNGGDYINKWKILTIWWDVGDKLSITWENTIIVEWWNIYIKNDLYNVDDSSSLLTLIAKRDKDTWNGWNIYIDTFVTNIDALLIADWSLLNMFWWEIRDVTNNLDYLRRQLLIYWSVYSSNTIWTDIMPYWSDYYENSIYPNNIMTWSIYDLWNLRTFNLNYWEFGKLCDESLMLAPMDWAWDYILNAWAWKKECYNSDLKDVNLRWSTRWNPVIIEYNTNINFIDPLVLKTN